MTATQEQFGSVKEDIRILSSMVSQIDQTVTIHTIRLNKIDTRLDRMDGRLDRMDGRLDRIDGRLDGLETAVSGLQGSVEEILTLVRKSQ